MGAWHAIDDYCIKLKRPFRTPTAVYNHNIADSPTCGLSSWSGMA